MRFHFIWNPQLHERTMYVTERLHAFLHGIIYNLLITNSEQLANIIFLKEPMK